VQVRDGLRPPRRPRRALDEGGVEEPVPAAAGPEAVVPEPDVRGADSVHEGGYGADGADRRRGGRGGGGGGGGEGAPAEVVEGLHPRRLRPRGRAPRHWIGAGARG